MSNVEKESVKKRVYAFDFDGVIAEYSGFQGIHHTEKPKEEVVKAIRQLKSEGHRILIYSTRGNELIQKYCADHDIPIDYINRNPEREGENPGKPIAYVYVDDRAICYRDQSAEKLVEEIKNFKAHWEK
ncbi:MAG: hypothetical protein AAB594_00040 [Patescibacteria group bacterium]